MLHPDLPSPAHALTAEHATRQRLLDAAGEVFSRNGFHDATIREICALAGANVAAVNYHFRDKQGLYAAVLQYADRCAGRFAEASPILDDRSDPRAGLRGFIHAYMGAMLDAGRSSWHGRLIAREMMDPSPALDAVIDRSIRPRSELLSALVSRLLGPAATERLVIRVKFSIIGQCLAYYSGRHVHKRLHPGFELSPENVAEIADHVADFSLAAIDALRRDAAPAPPPEVRS
ncbi:MAG: CerR family C-terminal domain-containing protein [Phycisphaerales bacterium]